MGGFLIAQVWAGRDSNPQPLRDTVLSRKRIPIPPPAHLTDYFISFFSKKINPALKQG
jgi:hypothetical protein